LSQKHVILVHKVVIKSTNELKKRSKDTLELSCHINAHCSNSKGIAIKIFKEGGSLYFAQTGRVLIHWVHQCLVIVKKSQTYIRFLF
jgi:sucrose-6-phosphate hydrolase SacC (GH32 family)